MITQTEIESTLAPLNGIYFDIPDLQQYAKKILTHGQHLVIRDEQSRTLVSYVLYYDNRSTMFISMVWTHPDHRGKRHATELLRKLMRRSPKDIILEVHRDSPAAKLYKSLGFVIAEEQANKLRMVLPKRMAIMQPYIFPYLGYFHLIEASHSFVFLDDVQFIKRGWINRNRILLDGSDHRFTVPVSNSSQNVPINETVLAANEQWKVKLFKTMAHAYRRAPFFAQVMQIFDSIMSMRHPNIADMAIHSIACVYDYLGVDFHFTRSSMCSPGSRYLDKADRLIEICKSQGYRRYVNAAGGKEIYDRSYFLERGIELNFVASNLTEYTQFNNEFVPGLSIIDAMMFNDSVAVRQLLREYEIS